LVANANPRFRPAAERIGCALRLATPSQSDSLRQPVSRCARLERCAAQQSAGKEEIEWQGLEKHPAGAKAHVLFGAFSARLKSCPFTKLLRSDQQRFCRTTCKAEPFQDSVVAPIQNPVYAAGFRAQQADMFVITLPATAPLGLRRSNVNLTRRIGGTRIL